MAIKLLLTKIKKTFKSFFITKKVEERKKEKRKKYIQFLKYIWQQIILRKKINKKAKQNPKNKKVAKSSKKEKDNQSYNQIRLISENELSYIQKIIQTYEEFIRRDFTMLIKEANTKLREWKSAIIAKADNKIQLSSEEISILHSSLQQMYSLYHDTDLMLNQFSQDFYKYQKIVKDVQRQIQPEQEIKRLNVQINKIILGLEKGKELVDLKHNNDYKFISRYINKSSVNNNKVLSY